MKSFSEFWPFYLQEHSNPLSRRLHFVGWMWLWMPVIGYGFAWVGHFIIEKNRPATFEHPLWSRLGDFIVFYQMCAGKLWSL